MPPADRLLIRNEMDGNQDQGVTLPSARPTPTVERFQAVIRRLDPRGEWQARYPELAAQCVFLVDQFQQRIAGYLTPEQQDLVADALLASFQSHGLTLRKSRDALFFEHPLATADYLASYRLDAPTLAAALLHDVVEDTTMSVSQIVGQFGPEVGKIVDGVTRLQATGKQVTVQAQHDAQVDTTNRLFEFMVEDLRVVVVKLADRLHNMRTLAALSRKKQEEKAREVLAVYAPLAYRLGMWDVKSELQELALKILEPVLYNSFQLLMERRARNQERWLDIVRRSLTDQVASAGLDPFVEAAPQQIYTLYQEYERAGRLPSQLPDLIRVVVVLSDRCDCYRALCAVHELWNPVPGTFDDYIAQPRENLYRALHTTVFGPGGRLLKVRFRTREMHQIAHHGILARWSAEFSEQEQGFEGLQRLTQRLRPVEGIPERADRLSAYREVLTDQIQVFTPEGEMIELPAGSTPLDLAYQIHTKLGDEADVAIINGLPMPLNTRLRSGDQVRIERSRAQLPRREWLDEDLGYVHSTYARSHIRRAYRRLRESEGTEIGRLAVEREMRMMGLAHYDLAAIARQMDYPSVQDLLVAIARADVMPYRVAEAAMSAVWASLEDSPAGEDVVAAVGDVQVRGLSGRPVKRCSTCKPAPGDPILGNLLRSGHVRVHRLDCHHIAHASKGGERLNLVEVDWVKQPLVKREIHIRLAATQRSGLAYAVTQVLEAEQINILEVHGRTDRENRVGMLAISVELTDLHQLIRILHRIGEIAGVKGVQRVDSPYRPDDDSMQWAIEEVRRA